MLDHNHDNLAALEVIKRHPLPGRVKLDTHLPPIRSWVVVLIPLVLGLSIYIFLSTSELLERFQTKLAGVEGGDAARIQQYNQQLESLQSRMTVFVADSVETKLRTLEKNVAAGAVGPQEIKILEELKGEVKLLESYSIGKGGNQIDLSRLDHPRFQITPATYDSLSSSDLLHEVSRMKHLLYLGIASCGLVGLAIGGYWWHTYARNRRLYAEAPKYRVLERRTDQNQPGS